MEAGDSVGVWTFNKQIGAQFPTFTWMPDQAAAISSNLVGYLRKQRYSGDSTPAVLQAPLNRVVADSKRLTVVLFCDGSSDISGTPYDQGINQTFRDSRAECAGGDWVGHTT